MSEPLQDPFEQEPNSQLNRDELLKGIYTEASNGKRFLNYLIDTVVFYAVMIGISAVLIVVTDMLSLFGSNNINLLDEDTDGIVLQIVLLLLYIAYYIIFEATLGKTAGKMFTRTRVLTVDGAKPSFGQIVGRNLIRLIPFDGFSFLWGSGWHDTMSHTVVVNEDSLIRYENPTRF